MLRALGLSQVETGLVVFLEGLLLTAASGIIGIASSSEALERGGLAREVGDVAWSLIEKSG